MSNKKSQLIISVFLLALLLSGCSVSLGSGGKKAISVNSDGGVFISANKGNTWKQMVSVPTVKTASETIGNVSVNIMTMDPNDSEAIYLGTVSKGLYYTYGVVDGWSRAKTLPLADVVSVTVDPKDKCTIYAAGGNKVFRSEDCSRGWAQIYYDNDPAVGINAIAVDNKDSNIIYIGTERGDVLKSSDKGSSWQPIFRGKDAIIKISISPFNNQMIFVSTEDRGTARSADGGLTWVDLEKNLEEFKNSRKFRDIAIASDVEGTVLLATTYGLLKSTDYGDTWARVDLLTPEKESTINSLALGSDSEEIYYVTDTTFYRSTDGGVSWTTVNLPSSKSGQGILVSPEDANVIYLCVKEKKK
jgi:photosystem II stability/assembly factor-like uncharacterized protein